MQRVVVIAVFVVACSGKKDAEKQQVPVPVAIADASPAPAPADATPAPADAAPAPADAATQAVDDEAPPDPAAPDITDVAFAFEVIPSTVSQANAGKALMRITVTNNSKRVISPVRYGYQFSVDGEESMQLSMSFGNGGYAKPWGELPPGKSATSEREGVDGLGLAPGTHEIVMSSWGRELARTKLIVTN